MKNENDLRIKKTRDSIRSAFIDLLKKKPLSSITVKELCDRAHCSRNTFYAHYSYKEAIYDQLVDECLAQIKHGLRPVIDDYRATTDTTIHQYVENIMEAVTPVKETLSFLLKNDYSGYFEKHLSDAIYAFICDYTSAAYPVSANTQRNHLYCRYTASGIAGFLVHWLTRTNISPDDAIDILYSIYRGSSFATSDFLVNYTPDSSTQR